MIVKAALVGLLYWISMGRAQYFFSFAFRKPVVLGVFIGLVFGDVQAGLLYGATIQLMYMAVLRQEETSRVTRVLQHVSQFRQPSQAVWTPAQQ